MLVVPYQKIEISLLNLIELVIEFFNETESESFLILRDEFKLLLFLVENALKSASLNSKIVERDLEVLNFLFLLVDEVFKSLAFLDLMLVRADI